MKRIIFGLFLSLFITLPGYCIEISNLGSYWGASGAYSKSVSQKAYYNSIFIIAKEIYQNGGLFCPIRIITDYSITNSPFSYYELPSSTCITICKPGYKGNKCETNKTANDLCGIKTNYEDVFRPSMISNPISNFTTNVTNNINIFDTGSSTQNGGTYYITTLGVIDFVENGVKVAPIKISKAKNNTDATFIVSTLSDDNYTAILCPMGYQVQNNKCVKPDDCTGVKATKTTGSGNNNSPEWCNGWDNSNITENSNSYEIFQVGNCKQYRCKQEDYGFEDESSKHCISCPETAKSHINNDGVCIQCTGEKQFILDGECTNATKEFSKSQMRQNSSSQQCWIEIDPDRYKECVI